MNTGQKNKPMWKRFLRWGAKKILNSLLALIFIIVAYYVLLRSNHPGLSSLPPGFNWFGLTLGTIAMLLSWGLFAITVKLKLRLPFTPESDSLIVPNLVALVVSTIAYPVASIGFVSVAAVIWTCGLGIAVYLSIDGLDAMDEAKLESPWLLVARLSLAVVGAVIVLALFTFENMLDTVWYGYLGASSLFGLSIMPTFREVFSSFITRFSTAEERRQVKEEYEREINSPGYRSSGDSPLGRDISAVATRAMSFWGAIVFAMLIGAVAIPYYVYLIFVCRREFTQ